VSELNPGLIADPLFVGATRPPMRWGVTYSALLFNMVFTMEAFLLTKNLLTLLLCAPIHGVCMLLCARDARFFDLVLLQGLTGASIGKLILGLRVVNAQGNPVQPTITIPQNASGIAINAQGQLSVTLPGSTTPTTVGQIGLTRFINKAGLQPIGDNLFTDTPASGPPQDGIANTDGFGDMQQSNLEQANVEVVTEISDLIAAQRAYEMNAKVISAADQMLQSAAALFR